MAQKSCLEATIAVAKETLANFNSQEFRKIAADIEDRWNEARTDIDKRAIIESAFEDRDMKWAEASKARKLLQELKNKEVLENVRDSLGKGQDPIEVLRGITGQSLRQVTGGEISVQARANAYKEKFMSVYTATIDSDPELKALLESGTIDSDIYTELDALQTGSKFVTKNVYAQKIAKNLHQINEIGAKFMERNVPEFQRIKGYLMRMSWNKDRIISDRGQFIDFMMRNYGEGTFPNYTVQQRLRAFGEIYEGFASGMFGRNVEVLLTDPGAGGIMTRLAATRELIPNNTQAGIEARKRFGNSIHSTVWKYMDSVSNDMAILEQFGPRAGDLLAAVLNEVKDHQTRIGKEIDVESSKKVMIDLYRQATGQANESPRGTLAKTVSAANVWTRITTLGQATLSSVTDLASAPLALATMNGKPYVINAAHIASKFLGELLAVGADKKKTALHIGLAADMMQDELAKISIQNSTGIVKAGRQASRMMNKLNLMEHWVTSLRNVIGTLSTMHWGERLNTTEFKDLNFYEKNALNRVGLGEKEWALFKKHTKSDKDFTWMDLDAIESIPDADISAYLKEKFGAGKTEPTKAMINQTRMELSGKMNSTITKSANYGTSTPDLREQQAMTLGLSQNTAAGQAIRVVMMFKSAALTTFNNYRRSYHLAETKHAAASLLAQSAGLGMMFYAISQYAKDAAKGKEPRDPLDPAFIAEAAAGAGFGGMYLSMMSDSLRGATGPYAALENLALTAAGPTATKVGLGALSLFWAGAYGAQAAAGVPERKRVTMPGKLLVNQAQAAIPFNNLFYIKPALDYYLLDGFKNDVVPGYLRDKIRAESKKDIKNFEGTGKREYFMFDPKNIKR